MKRLYLILALCVSSGTMAYSQITITSDQCRTLIARLDTLSYLRAGNADLQMMYQNLELQCYQKDTIIWMKDSSYQAQARIKRDAEERLEKSMKSEYKYRGIAIGAGAAAVLTTGAMILVMLLR